MYELIYWACLVTANPVCDRGVAIGHQYHVVDHMDSRAGCEEYWKQLDAADPDPPQVKSNHICQPVEVPL